jgi:homoserine dehydrogenase
VLQHEAEQGSKVLPLVIMTHETTEGAAAKACAEIESLDCVRGDLVRMWVRD